MMLFFILFGLFRISFECCAQDLTSSDQQPIPEEAIVNEGVKWNISRPAVTLTIRDGRSRLAHGPQNKIYNLPLVYSNQWRPFLMPIRAPLYRNQNLHFGENGKTDEQFEPTVLYRPASDFNETTTFPHPYTVRNRYFNPYETARPYPFPTTSLQNRFVPGIPQIRPPMFYPAALSINVRRSYTNNMKKDQNSSDSEPDISVTEPLTSSFEERYSQLLPSLPFPGMSLMPNTALPFQSYGYPRRFFPTLPSAYVPTYSILPPEARDSSPPLENDNVHNQYYDRESGIENASEVQRQPEIERPVPVEEFSATYYVPRGVSSIVAPHPLPLRIGTLPFIQPSPIKPPLIPNTVAPRDLPQNQPSLLPQTFSVPVDTPTAEEMAQPVIINDRLPLDTSYESVPSEAVLPTITQVSESLQTVPDEIQQEESPIASKIPYEFGFDMSDGKGTDQHRMESSDASGVVRGSYGYRDVLGVYRLVNYVADKNGFRAFVKSNEPGVGSSGSADVIVVAEQPPKKEGPIEEGPKATEEDISIVPKEPADLIVEGSDTDKE